MLMTVTNHTLYLRKLIAYTQNSIIRIILLKQKIAQD